MVAQIVKLLFTTTCFVGFYSMSNLIVIIFNLLYPICIVGFHCMGCVIERVVWRLKHLKTEEDFTGILRLNIPWSISCVLHVLECEESGQMEIAVSREYLMGSPSRETLAWHSVLSAYQVWYTLSMPTLFIHILPTNGKESLWEKTLAKHLKS